MLALFAVLLLADAPKGAPFEVMLPPEPLPSASFASVPESADAALVVQGYWAMKQLTAFLPQLGGESGALAPGPIGQELRRMFGVDLLEWRAVHEAGINFAGSFTVVVGDHAIGLSAPVDDEARARKSVTAFLAQLGPARVTRGAPLKGPLASGGGSQERAGWVVKTTDGLRLITTSGRGAVTLAIHLGHIGRAQEPALSKDPQIAAAQERLPSFLLAWVRSPGTGPLRGAVLRLRWTAHSLDAQGLLLPSPASKERLPLAQLLDGESPPRAACGPALLCARAAPGALLRQLLEQSRGEALGRALRSKAQRDPFDQLARALAAGAVGGALLRLDSFDARAITTGAPRELESLEVLAASGAAAKTMLPGANEAGEVTLLGPPAACAGVSAGLQWLSSPCKKPGPEVMMAGGPRELSVRLDTPALWKALGPITALDALRGPAAGMLAAVKLLWGGLLAVSGPIELTVRPPEAGLPPALEGSLELELAWPLPGKAGGP